jgi:hypothetical protein
MAFDLLVWSSPRELDADAAGALVHRWLDEGGDPARALRASRRHRVVRPRAAQTTCPTSTSSRMPSRPSPLGRCGSPRTRNRRRVAAIRLARDGRVQDELESIFGLATKYDLMVYEPARHRVMRPMQVMADHASATFWPRGAIQAAVGGALGSCSPSSVGSCRSRSSVGS